MKINLGKKSLNKMEWEYNTFMMTLQPIYERSLSDVGAIRMTLQLNEELTAGILLMAYNLWGDTYLDHITLELINAQQEVYIYQAQEYFETYEIVQAQTIMPVEDHLNWIKYMTLLASQPVNQRRVPRELNMRFTCRFLNQKRNWSAIYQFDHDTFLRGAISLCSWLHLPWTEYLDNIHKGNISYSIT